MLILNRKQINLIRNPLIQAQSLTFTAAKYFTIIIATLASSTPVLAHHGWSGFYTERLEYISGSVSTEGVWGNPHSLFELALDSNLPAHTPVLTIPEELKDPADSSRVNAAVAYKGPNKVLKIIIAPPAWSGKWGLSRSLRVGERFQAVGYINKADNSQFRPVVFWYGEDAVPVNQVLGNSLPERAPLPE